MTARSITRVPELGQAWSGNWQARIVDRLRVRGFDSLTAFSESYSTASTIELAEKLSTDDEAGIDHGDVAAEQLVRMWREEVEHSGPEAIERFARRLLVGALHQDLPEGWRSDWRSEEAAPAMSRLAAASSGWICDLDEEHRPAARRVFSAMIDAGEQGRIPLGWLPATADDPLLVDFFHRHWSAVN
jgi:hypothetical protein